MTKSACMSGQEDVQVFVYLAAAANVIQQKSKWSALLILKIVPEHPQILYLLISVHSMSFKILCERLSVETLPIYRQI